MKINRIFVLGFIGLLLAVGLVFGSCRETTNIYQYSTEEKPGSEIPGEKEPGEKDPEEITEQKRLANKLVSYINENNISVKNDASAKQLLQFIADNFEGNGVSFIGTETDRKGLIIDELGIGERVHFAVYQNMIGESEVRIGDLFYMMTDLQLGELNANYYPLHNAVRCNKLLENQMIDGIQNLDENGIDKVGFTTIILNYEPKIYCSEDTINLILANKSIFDFSGKDLYANYGLSANKNKLVEEDVLGN